MSENPPDQPPHVRPPSPDPAQPGWDPGGAPPPGFHAAPPPGAYPPPPGFYPPPPPGSYPPPPGFSPPPPPGFYPGLPPGFYPAPDDPLVSADFNGWWSRGFTLLKVAWRPMTLVQLVWAVPLFAALVVFSNVYSDRLNELVITENSSDLDWRPFLEPLWYLVPLFLATLLLSLIASLATLDLVVRAATGRPLSIAGALLTGLRRVPALIGWGFLGGLLTIVGFVFCFLPGIYVSIVLGLLPVVVLLERGGAITRCFRLVHAEFGDALARLLVMMALSSGFGFVQSALTNILFPAAGTFGNGEVSLFGSIGAGVITTALSMASAVVLAPLHVTAYADLRARHEPFSTAYLTAS